MTYDTIVIGSGFGGSVAALRLAERGERVLVLERGRRFADADFARSNWDVRRSLWAPAIGCTGIMQMSVLRDVIALHGSGVGGGSLVYACVLVEPDARTFARSAWRTPVDWPARLAPFYAVARQMLGVAPNPRFGPADETLRAVATELGHGASFRPAPVGIFFGEPGREGALVPDPYFGGDGPARAGCVHCGACMVGCRHNAKNTLPKNYLWLAERRGVEIRAEREAVDIRPLAPGQPDGARYEVVHRASTGMVRRLVARPRVERARSVIVAAGALGTLRLLFRCRDVTRSLPDLSPRLGDLVRTNSESLLGATARRTDVDYSLGAAITSIVDVDDVTTVEPVRYPAGSSLLRAITFPFLARGRFVRQVWRALGAIVTRPLDFWHTHLRPGWTQRTAILLVMQNLDHRLRVRLGRGPLTLFRRDLVSVDCDEGEAVRVETGREVMRRVAARTGAIPGGVLTEELCGVPLTAHILGGCPIGATAAEGVVNDRLEVHGYPGLRVIDGSVMPGNPGVNPSLTIAAFAEYAMAVDIRPPAVSPSGYTLRAPADGGRRTLPIGE